MTPKHWAPLDLVREVRVLVQSENSPVLTRSHNLWIIVNCLRSAREGLVHLTYCLKKDGLNAAINSEECQEMRMLLTLLWSQTIVHRRFVATC